MDEKIIEVIKEPSKNAPSITSGEWNRIGPDKVQYDLFFTNKRIIAATVFSQSDISRVAGKAYFQQIFYWKKTREKRRREFEGKKPDEMLKLHKDSFDLPYNEIKSIFLKRDLIDTKLIINFNFHGNEKGVKFKVPKNMVQNVEKLINIYIPYSKDKNMYEKKPPNFVLERKNKKYLFLFILAIIGCVITIWPISAILVKINFYLSIILSFALFIIFAISAPFFLEKYWNQNQ